ncbi:MAG TPA: SCO family protein [Fluviicola sp.]|nr:SCO family protein [Fluviicola sp.]
MKKSLFFVLVFFLFASCSTRKEKKALSELPSDSIFHLSSTWENQHGDKLKLDQLRGKTLVVVMIYTTCRSACPILVSDMKKIAQSISKENLDKVSLVLISIDPETDTPEALNKFAKDRKMTEPYWVFLRGDNQSTPELANVLSMKYKKISPIDFSHSNIISIFNTDGELVSQEEGLRINTKQVAEKVDQLVKQSK